MIMYMTPRRHPRCTPMLFSCLIGNAPPNSTPLEHKCPLANTMGNNRDLCAASFSGGLCDGADISLVNASHYFAATTSKMGQKADLKRAVRTPSSFCLVGAALARRGAGSLLRHRNNMDPSKSKKLSSAFVCKDKGPTLETDDAEPAAWFKARKPELKARFDKMLKSLEEKGFVDKDILPVLKATWRKPS